MGEGDLVPVIHVGSDFDDDSGGPHYTDEEIQAGLDWRLNVNGLR